jgi:hypothetical protein
VCAVYLFLGEHDAMVDMLAIMEERELLTDGQYAVLHVDLDHVNNEDPLFYFKRESDKRVAAFT